VSPAPKKSFPSDPAPPDPEAKVLRCTISASAPRYVNPEGSFAIWTGLRDREEIAKVYRQEIAMSDQAGRTISAGRSKEIEKFLANPSDSQLTIKGPLARVSGGETLLCKGRWRHDDRYGWSFQVYDYSSALPQDAAGIAAWLETRVQGVGPVFAEAIVDHFGVKNVYKALDTDPGRLGEVRTSSGRGLAKKQLDEAVSSWGDVQSIREIETFLFGHGVSANRADTLYRRYGEDVIDVLEKTPYKITEIKGIGFQNADRIAQSVGVEVDDPNRIDAGILYVLEKAEESGHVYLGLDEFLGQVGLALRIEDIDRTAPPPAIAAGAERLRDANKVVVERDEHLRQRIYLQSWWETERNVARMVRGMISSGHRLLADPKRPLAAEGASEEEIEKLQLPTDDQWSVIETVSEHRMTILSGLPGAGKCVSPETEIFVDGERRVIAALWRSAADLDSLEFDGNGYWANPKTALTVPTYDGERLVQGDLVKLYRQQVSERMRRVRLQNGLELRITQAHRLLTLDGWSADLEPGDLVACPNLRYDPEAGLMIGPADQSGNYRVGISYFPITEIEEFEYEGWVYDIEVAAHHNYIANGVCSHNTASTNTLIKAAAEEGLRVLLAAPTGKAARRMRELTGQPASTIHRLLEYSPGENDFLRNENNPLVGDLLIIDESSMIQLDLFESLLRAIPDDMHLLLVGDPDQLPPVGAGKAFDDLIHAEIVPQIHLTQIFRQAAKSMIIQNARRLNVGEFPYLSRDQAESAVGEKMLNDFFWISQVDADQTATMTVSVAVERIPTSFGFDPRRDIMVLAPQREGRCGLHLLNARMELLLNGDEKGEYKRAIVNRKPAKVGDDPIHTSIAVGSRIVQTKNLYHSEGDSKSVMNGEVGFVIDYDEDARKALLEFDDGDRQFWLPTADMDSFQLAWALTIHRSQGSQWPVVVVPVSMTHYQMLSRNLEYVAVTRAESLCVMVGEKRALSIAVKNVELDQRNSTLVRRIRTPEESGELF